MFLFEKVLAKLNVLDMFTFALHDIPRRALRYSVFIAVRSEMLKSPLVSKGDLRLAMCFISDT